MLETGIIWTFPRVGAPVTGASCATSPRREDRPRPRPDGRLRAGLSSLMPRPPAWAGARSTRERGRYRLATRGSDERRAAGECHGWAVRRDARCAVARWRAARAPGGRGEGGERGGGG